MKSGTRIYRSLLLLPVLTIMAVCVTAQVQVTVVINRLSSGRYPTKLYQFQQYPNVVTVTLTNTTAMARRIYINGTMTGDNGIMIRTKAGYTPGAIELAAFQQRRLNAMEVAQLFDQSAVEVLQGGQNARNNIIRDQALPEGMYQVCVRAYDYATRQPVSPEEPLGCSNTFLIAMLEAPVILSPMDQDSIKAFTPQNMVLRWSVPPGAPPSTQYTIKIVEAFKAYNQTAGSYFQANANEIIQTTPTPIFETTITGAGSYLYGPGQPPLVKGRTYAMVVTARDIQQQAQFRNSGQSQAILFKYGITAFDDQAQFVVVKKDTLPKQPTTVRGTLQYRFAEDTLGKLFPIAYERVYLQKVFVKQDTVNGAVQYTPLSAMETKSLPPYQDVIDGEMAQTDAAGRFELHFGMTTLDSAGVIPADKWDQVFADNSAYPVSKSRKLSPLAASGQLSPLQGRLACLYRLVVSNPHYLAYQQYLEVTPGGVRDVSNLVLDANSYTLKVNVREVFNGRQGAFATGADVKIYRLTHHKQNRTLGIPLYEGDITDSARDWQEYGDKVLIASRTTPVPAQKSDRPEDYTVSFSRLLRSTGAEPYQYLVMLEKGGVVLQSVSYGQLQMITGAAGNKVVQTPANTQPVKNNTSAATAIDIPVVNNTAGFAATPGTGKAVEKNNLTANLNGAVLNEYISNTVKGMSGGATTDSDKKEGKPVATDKWINWSYHQSPAIATLTLQKELVTPPRSRLTGTLEYKYKNDNATPVQPYANKPVRLMVMYVFSQQDAPSVSGSSKPANSGNSSSVTGQYTMTGNTSMGNFNYQKIADTYASMDPVSTTGNGMQLVKMDHYERVSGTSWGNDNGQVLQTVYTDAQGRFSFDFENADSTMQVTDGTWYTGHGDLTVTHTGKLMRVYRIVPGIAYYCAPDDNIAMQPWGDYDCGTLTSFVRTYNLNIHVTDNNLKNFEGVPVKLYRSERNAYLNQLPERPGEDLNQRVTLFGGSSPGGSAAGAGNTSMQLVNFPVNNGNVAAANNNGSNNAVVNPSNTVKAVYQPVLQQSANYFVSATNTVTIGAVAGNKMAKVTGSASRVAGVAAQYQPVLNNAYLLKRAGFTGSEGVVTFKNLVLSRNRKNDTWLIQADGETGNRTGAITFETAYLDYPAESMNKDYSDKWYQDYYAANPGAYPPIGGPYVNALTNAFADTSARDILFNSEFDPNVTADAYLLAKKNPPRIAGRVLDDYTTLGIPGITIRVEQEILQGNRVCYNTSYATNGRCPYNFYAATDANGYFDVQQFSDYYARFSDQSMLDPANMQIGVNTRLVVEAPGYEPYSLPLSAVLLWGKQVFQTITLKPVGTNCFGYVTDAADTTLPVAARIKLKINGRWVDTYAYSGNKYKMAEKSNYLLANGIYSQMLDNAVTAGYQLAQSPSAPAGAGTPVQVGDMHVTVMPMNTPNMPNTGNVMQTGSNRFAVANINMKPVANAPAVTGNWSSYIQTAQQSYGGAANNADNRMVGTVVQNGLSDRVTGLLSRNVSGMQRFDIDLPARPDSIIIMPYDPAYITVTKAVKVSASGQYLGLFPLQRRKHKVEVTVKMRSGTTGYVVNGAAVAIDGVNSNVHTGQNGKAYFEFVNNATHDFTVRVTPDTRNNVQQIIFVPESANFSSGDDGTTTLVTVWVSPGEKISGKVLFAGNGHPVSGATVYLDQKNGTNSAVQAITRTDGSYTLVGVPKPASIILNATPTVEYVVKATYSAPGKTYVGDSKTVHSGAGSTTGSKQPAAGNNNGQGTTIPGLPQSGQPAKGRDDATPPEQEYAGIDLQIKEVAGIDLNQLYGMPVRVNSLRRGTDTTVYTIDGEFYNLPGNDNFSMRQDIPAASAIPFHQLKVKTSALHNAQGVPLGVPVENEVALDCRTLSVKAFSVFNAAVQADAAGNEVLHVAKAGNDTTGLLKGRVRITDNSFNFPTSYMTITGKDFFLGNYGQAANADKLQIPVFRSGAAAYALTKFSITNDQAAGITFKYLGFDGLTETAGSRESFVMGDSVNLFMNLSTTINGKVPLTFKSGHAVIRHDGLSRMVASDSIRFSLEQWTVSSGEWELSPNSGGILLKKGILYTSKADLPFTDMAIIPGELTCNSLNGSALRAAAGNGKLTLGGGAAQLKIYSGTEVVFVYDADAGTQAGKGHYKLSLRSDAGKVAYFGGLDGMTNASQRFNIQFLSLLSNNEDIFAFDPDTPPVTFYNQMQYSAQRLFAYEDRLVLDGTVSLGIAGVPDNIAGTFTFYHVRGEAGRTNRLNITPLQFSFTGAGGAKFTTSAATPNTQQFTRYGIGIAGDVNMPDVANTLKANLLSMVTDGAREVIQAAGNAAVSNATVAAVKQQAEVYIGDVLNRGAEFADEAQDYVKGVVNDARNQLMNQLNEVRSTLQQSLPIGSEQTMADLAAKWRLAGEGMDAIKGFDQNPVGSLLRLNGVFKGFTGMDIKDAVEQRAKMVANEALKGAQESLPVEQMSDAANSFKGMKFDFDLKNGRIMGSLSMPTLNFGAVVLKDIGIEMLMDRQGWYFYSGAGLDLPQAAPLHPLIFPLSVGMLIGNYPVISPALEARVTQASYVKKLPKTFSQGIHGFFLTGKKEIISATSVSVQVLDVDFEIGASAGLDARVYANFGHTSQQIGIGAMAFGNAYAKMSVLFGSCGVKGDVGAELGVKATFTNDPNGVTVEAKACASLTISGSVWCLMVNGSYSKSIMALLQICGGANCRKAIDFSIKLDGGTCSTSNEFDY